MSNRKLHNEFTIPHEVLEDPKFLNLTFGAKVLYMFLCKHKNRYSQSDGFFWRSMAQLSNDIKMSESTTKRSKKELKEAGFIEIKRGKYSHKKNRAPDWYGLNGFKEI